MSTDKTQTTKGQSASQNRAVIVQVEDRPEITLKVRQLPDQNVRERLEELRFTLRSERIGSNELHELQSLAQYIEPGDVELLEAAGVPEFPETPAQHSPYDPESGEAFKKAHGFNIKPPAQHSPLPWTIDNGLVRIEDQAQMLIDDAGTEREWIALGINDEEGFAEVIALAHPSNAKLIVASVNNATALAEALRAWEYAGSEGGISMVDWFEVARKKTRAALAQWEGAKS